VENEWNNGEQKRDAGNERRCPVDAHLRLFAHVSPTLHKKFGLRLMTRLTPLNICVVKSGNAAATPERIMVLAANAEAAYFEYESTT
jgi:hypothetical protein